VLFPQPLSPIKARLLPLVKLKEIELILGLSLYEKDISFTTNIAFFAKIRFNFMSICHQFKFGTQFER
jgi:hypothetical protein